MFLKSTFLLIFQIFLGFDPSYSRSTPYYPSQWTMASPSTPSGGLTTTNCTQFSTSRYYWFKYNNGNPNCFYITTPYNKVSWHQAHAFCLSQGAELVSIHSYDMNYWLTHRDAPYWDTYSFIFWTGLNSLTKRGEYRWSDNSPSNFDRFASVTSTGDSIPGNVLDQGRCVSLKSMPKNSTLSKTYLGYWFKDDCTANNRYICQKSTVATSPITPAPPLPGNCPKGWFQYANQKCVKYMNVSMTFNQSRDLCVKTNGGEMLSIHSEEEQNFITAFTAGKPSPYIGLKRNYYDYYGGWNWDDSKKTDFTNWGLGETNYYYYNSWCVNIITNDTQPGKWTVVNCTQKHSVVCEKQLDTSITTPGQSYATSKCRISGFDNYIQYRNSCYSVVDSTDGSNALPFSDAKAKCSAKPGGSLVSIQDAFEEAFLRYYIKQYGKADMYWTGLHSDSFSNNNVSQAFDWTDNWPVYYTHWDEYEPQNPDLPQEECVLFAKSNGTWRTSMCALSNAYICKVSAIQMPKIDFDKRGVCPTVKDLTDNSMQWVDIDRTAKHCYWFSIDRKGNYGIQSWVDASFHCRQRNGTLASIHSKHELMLLKNKLGNTGYYYKTWIGLSSDPNGEYIWEDGSALQYTNWDLNEKIVQKSDLIKENSNRQCVEMKTSDAMWKQQPCAGSKRNYYICEVNKIYPTSLTDQEKSGKSAGMSGGAKAGIAFGVIGGIVSLAAIGYFVMKRNRANSPGGASFGNSLYASRRGNEPSTSNQ